LCFFHEKFDSGYGRKSSRFFLIFMKSQGIVKGVVNEPFNKSERLNLDRLNLVFVFKVCWFHQILPPFVTLNIVINAVDKLRKDAHKRRNQDVKNCLCVSVIVNSKIHKNKKHCNSGNQSKINYKSYSLKLTRSTMIWWNRETKVLSTKNLITFSIFCLLLVCLLTHKYTP